MCLFPNRFLTKNVSKISTSLFLHMFIILETKLWNSYLVSTHAPWCCLLCLSYNLDLNIRNGGDKDLKPDDSGIEMC